MCIADMKVARIDTSQWPLSGLHSGLSVAFTVAFTVAPHFYQGFRSLVKQKNMSITIILCIYILLAFHREICGATVKATVKATERPL